MGWGVMPYKLSYLLSICGVDSIYYRVNGELTEIMRVLGRQDATERL